MIRAVVVSGLLGTGMLVAGGPTVAQALDIIPVAALPAPRLAFSESEMQLAQAVAQDPGLADFYGSNGLQPIFQGAAAEPRRVALIDAVGQAASHGLPPARYGREHLQDLQASGADSLAAEMAYARVFAEWTHDLTGGILDPQKVESGIKRSVERRPTGELLRGFVASADPAAFIDALAPRDPRYQALRRALQDSTRLAAPMGVALVPQGTWREGTAGPGVAALRQRLTAIGFDAGPAPDPQLFDAPLTQTVAAYQAEAGLPADGVAGPRTVARLNGGPGGDASAIQVSLERMRWMNGHDPMARQVWVNLPEYTARIMDGGAEIFSTRVVIGKAAPDFETPEFSETMKYIVVNPRWNVPRSITVKEYLPKLKANRNAVRHLDIVDGAGNVIPRDRIDFSRYSASSFPYRMRQKPSDDNALGIVKFMFPNPWNIYLHDTPTKHLFNESRRAYSHGCIRIGRPIDLAYGLLLNQVGNPEAVFQKALASGRETYLNLRDPIPVHLVYFTAFPDESGRIQRFPDIYGRDALVHAALVKAAGDRGLDFAALDD